MVTPKHPATKEPQVRDSGHHNKSETPCSGSEDLTAHYIGTDSCRRNPNVHEVFSAKLSSGTTAKRETKKHLCDYLNRLNGYARNADIQFDNGGRQARDHVKRFLETCEDRGLERRLCHIRVSDIHVLEDMIVEILRIDERNHERTLTDEI
ncbi:hypothetical protein PHMEG_00011108 [Phytophthora megakarya]|uniref:Uncharacterized protein n=1 Tax=Phytophthora megakarya TaxID=4795 RepID=A0A225WDQ5_9STRA|nr:hypothetical protein PHMEG_00011108 [Phytophthora megakarya]